MKFACGIAAFFLVFSLASGAEAQIGKPEKIAAAQAPAMMHALAGNQTLDLSLVFIARVTIDGTRRDLTSLKPEILGHSGDGTKLAMSVARIDKEKSQLILFTLNPQNGAGSRLVIPLAALEKKPQFSFPIVNEDGTVSQRKFAVLDYRHMP
jgi:hypothetical protein